MCIRIFIAFIIVSMFCCFHATQLSINMGNASIECGILCSNENEWTAITHNIDQRKSDTKGHSEYHSIHIKFKKKEKTNLISLRNENSYSLWRGWVTMIRRGKRDLLKCWSSTFSWSEWWLHGCDLSVKICQGDHSWCIHLPVCMS